MIQEKLSIHHFGGISEMELTFKRINVLIGPQASGKSLVVKLAYFFKGFFLGVYRAIQEGKDEEQIIEDFLERFSNGFLYRSGKHEDFRIRYEIGAEYWEVTGSSERKPKLAASEGVELALRSAIAIYARLRTDLNPNTGAFGSSAGLLAPFTAEYLRLIPKELLGEPVFVPAGRGFFTSIRASVFSYFREKRRFDPFFVDFADELESALRYSPPTFAQGDPTEERFNALFHQVLKGDFLFEGDEPYIVHPDGRQVHLSMTSSGQQEALPLLLLLKQFRTWSRGIGTGDGLFIEEPEGHIFPVAQKQVVHLMAHVFNRGGCQLFVTTHSPFILTAFNNLLEGGSALERHPDRAEAILQIVPKEELLYIQDFAAYSLEAGHAQDMIDHENGLIHASLIDAVTEEIAMEFDQILDLKYD